MPFVVGERKLITRPHEVQQRLPPFFSNLLPERDGVLRDYLAQRAGISPEREFPLLWLVGADLPGAVIAEDSEGQPLPPEEKIGNARRKQGRSAGSTTTCICAKTFESV